MNVKQGKNIGLPLPLVDIIRYFNTQLTVMAASSRLISRLTLVTGEI